ncbi:unnamed protein product [Euphydryas editha]|uniref:Uncharacterized protein n=1 Tax=Euphydryas editha TaxID=104508 RepID=A0AAU9UUG9_EUPED|nr:unnamed protein product [Euphydryas editha]
MGLGADWFMQKLVDLELPSGRGHVTKASSLYINASNKEIITWELKNDDENMTADNSDRDSDGELEMRVTQAKVRTKMIRLSSKKILKTFSAKLTEPMAPALCYSGKWG